MVRRFLAVTWLLTGLLVLGERTTILGDAPKEKAKYTNRLASETSPYLLMHAHNPTDWYPWGPEAFAKAKKEDKLIFLSIGYSSCFWCHVMERESFNNDEVAKILNENFVCIKVDREARPEVDQIYMTALQQLRQSSGWPLSMFLLPDGRPVLGGTYWPREDRTIEDQEVRGFKSILAIVRSAWKDDRKALEAQADKLATATTRTLEKLPGPTLVPLDRKLVQEVVDGLKEVFDPEYGGFGNRARAFRGTKFPMPPRLSLILQQAERQKDAKLLAMVTLTLDRMAEGGIYDQIGGGFHRYSTERTWTVPHFEKMLYDNGQLVELYAHAYKVTKHERYRRVVEETLAYIDRETLSPEGAIYSSQDAETHGEEGRFYVWTSRELADALPEKADLDLIRDAYAAAKPNFEEKYHILRLAKPLPELATGLKLAEPELQKRLHALNVKLLAVRSQRDRPFLNKVALTSWSGLMIAGYAEAGQALAKPEYLRTAARAADFILAQQMTAEGRLFHTYGAQPGQAPKAAGAGYLEDYTFFVHGLLNLYDATKEQKWLTAAGKLTDTMIEQFGDQKAGGFYFTAHDHERFFARTKDQYDGVTPSGNSVAARNLVRLWRATGTERYQKEAERSFQAFAGALSTDGPSVATLAQALDLSLDER